MKKRILSLALCLLLLVTAFPVTASGDSVNGCGPNLTWRFDASSGKLTIVGSGSMSTTAITARPGHRCAAASNPSPCPRG